MTNGYFIVQDRKAVHGDILTLPQGGTVNLVPPVLMAGVMVHNMTADIVRVVLNFLPVDNGNQNFYLAPGAAMTIGDYPGGHITDIVITDTTTLGNGGGFVIVNSFFN